MIDSVIMATLQIFGLLAIGVVVRLLGYIRHDEVDRWSKFVLDVFYPLMVFMSIINDLEVNRLNELWPLPVLGFGLICIGWTVSFAGRFGLEHKGNTDMVKTFAYLCAINNSAYLPVIIVSDLYGKVAVANLFLLNLGSNVGIWTIGVGILKGLSFKETCQKIFTPTLIAIVLGTVLAVTGWSSFIPPVFRKVLTQAGSITIPLILILIGASLWGAPLLKYIRDTSYTVALRILIIPILSLLILIKLPLSKDVFAIAAIVACMPAPAIAPIFARRFGGNPDFAAAVTFVSTVASIIVVPVILGFFLK